jgi:hypothetical protein
MVITDNPDAPPWLILVFTLPSSKASERVQIWRKLQKFGSIQFRNAGSLLPNNAVNMERAEWLAKAIRDYKGEASILQVQSIDDLSPAMLKEQFRRARSGDYSAVLEELQKVKPSAMGAAGQIARLRRRFDEIVAVDFFESPIRGKVENALTQAEQPAVKAKTARKGKASKADYQNRTWITRPRPGVDRVSSAWLISRFIDFKAKFVFGNNPSAHAKAVPFDMYQSEGFGHEGDRCTFETLCSSFAIADKKVRFIAQAIHDADLEDGKFGRSEGLTINQILQGWAKQDIPDDELLRRGMDLIEGLYNSIQ